MNNMLVAINQRKKKVMLKDLVKPVTHVTLYFVFCFENNYVMLFRCKK